MTSALLAEELLDAGTFLARLGEDDPRQELIHGRIVMMVRGRRAAFALSAQLLIALGTRLAGNPVARTAIVLTHAHRMRDRSRVKPGRRSRRVPRSREERFIDLSDWSGTRYRGEPSKRKWLAPGVFPMAALSVLAAMEDVGKSMLPLDLEMKVAEPAGEITVSCVGGSPAAEGKALILGGGRPEGTSAARRFEERVGAGRGA